VNQLFTYYIKNPLIIYINSGDGGVMVIRLFIDFGELVKVALKVGWEMCGWGIVHA
jgi:hypothetical protein